MSLIIICLTTIHEGTFVNVLCRNDQHQTSRLYVVTVMFANCAHITAIVLDLGHMGNNEVGLYSDMFEVTRHKHVSKPTLCDSFRGYKVNSGLLLPGAAC
jgi:uncharacterized Fe-S cluster-containing MiaB family protein